MSTHINLTNETFHIGETITVDIACHDADGLPINLTGATLAFRLASRSSRLLDAVLGDGVSITDAPAGKCRIIITPAMQTSANVQPGDHFYEFKLTTAGGAVSIQAEGLFPIADSLFRRYV